MLGFWKDSWKDWKELSDLYWKEKDRKLSKIYRKEKDRKGLSKNFGKTTTLIEFLRYMDFRM